jgi:hypothetical protein
MGNTWLDHRESTFPNLKVVDRVLCGEIMDIWAGNDFISVWYDGHWSIGYDKGLTLCGEPEMRTISRHQSGNYCPSICAKRYSRSLFKTSRFGCALIMNEWVRVYFYSFINIDMVCTQFETLTHSSLNSPSGKWLSLNKSDIVHQVLNTAISVEHDRLMKITAQKMTESPSELCS